MQAAPDPLDLTPPPAGRWLGPIALALVAHSLLVVALTWGVSWERDAPPVVFEAEIWSHLPQPAAPRAAEPAPIPPAPAEAAPIPPPAPAEPVPPRVAPTPEPADIAIQQARQQAEEARAVAQRAEAQRERQQRLADQRREREAQQAAQRAAAERERQQRLSEQRREREAQQAAQLREEQRDEQLRRVLGQAGASGAAQASGTALQASGPSPGYAARVAARIQPNVVFTDTVSGNPSAEVEVHTRSDGTITARLLLKSSGNPSWDAAVLRAIDRTATLPRDTDGRVPSPMIVVMRPLD